MENNLMIIAERLLQLIKQQELITEDTELNILHQLAGELIADLGEIERPEEVTRALVNMFMLGQTFNSHFTK